jgi:transcriptional regulator with XRE-family HTH domain
MTAQAGAAEAMGIFFDQDWFDGRLEQAGLTRAAMARAAGMTIDEIEMVFSDRRELEGPEIHAIARVLDADPSEIASRSGAADPGQVSRRDEGINLRPARNAAPEFAVTREVIAGIHERLDRLERLIEVVIHKLDRR